MEARKKNTRWSLTISTLLLSGWSLLTLNPVAAVTFAAPEEVNGAPSTETTGGATRNGGGCSAASSSQKAARALLPEGYPGLTIDERPTFFLYVPPTQAKEGNFSLQDPEQNQIYSTKLSLPATGGVISISLPSTVSALEMGKNYMWFVEINCFGEYDPDNPTIIGGVHRTQVNPTLARALEATSTYHERAEVYARSGIWYDSLSNLAAALKSQPEDATLVSSWEELLTSVGLAAYAGQPLAD